MLELRLLLVHLLDRFSLLALQYKTRDVRIGLGCVMGVKKKREVQRNVPTALAFEWLMFSTSMVKIERTFAL